MDSSISISLQLLRSSKIFLRFYFAEILQSFYTTNKTNTYKITLIEISFLSLVNIIK